MPAPFNKYNIHIDHRDTYTLTERDHGLMIEQGLTPGIEADEITYIHQFMVRFPDIFIGKYVMRESAMGNSTDFPAASAVVTKFIA